MVSQHEARRLVRPAVQLDLLDASGGDDLAALRTEMADAWRALAAARRALAEAEAGAADEQGAPGRAARARRRVRGGRPAAGRGGRPRARAQPPAPSRRPARGRPGRPRELLNPDEGAGRRRARRARRRTRSAACASTTRRSPARATSSRASPASCARRRVELRSYLDRARRRSGACSTASRSGSSSSPSCAGASAASTRPPTCARARRRRPSELAEGERADERIARAAAAVAAAEKTADRLATALHKGREKAAKPFARGVEGHLADMGMDGARLEVSIAEAPLGARGRDAVELRAGRQSRAARGAARERGLGRRALAHRAGRAPRGARRRRDRDARLRRGRRRHRRPHGARRSTDKLRELAATAQVLCITHLPQIAAAADRHFLVEKTQGATSEAHVAELTSDEALEELVRMLGADAGDTDARALAVSLRGHAHSPDG